ncbi:MAG TPA: Abi-alpha family protein, partial [Panacibacter sp.]|nr:Abi-alpha family protein [Panacibacter sp.]
VKWAALVANTVREDSKIETTIFSYILSQITPKEADLFTYIYDNCITIQDITPVEQPDILKATITDRNKGLYIGDLPKSNRNAELYIDNLVRLRIIKEIMGSHIETKFVCVTELGLRFMMACTFQ